MDPYKSEAYEVDNFEQVGKAYIFNVTEFKYDPKDKRSGSNKDVEKLNEVFNAFDFETEIVANDKTTLSCFNEKLDEIARKDFSKSASLVIALMSHGDGHHISMKDGKFFIEDIYKKFQGKNCPSLMGKPKIFIFQVCRGKNVNVASETSHQTDATSEPLQGVSMQSLPSDSDCLVCNATTKGFVSFRDIEKGSWYIQTLAKVLLAYHEGRITVADDAPKQDILHLLTIVSRMVAEKKDDQPAIRGVAPPDNTQTDTIPIPHSQMPTFLSTLTKLFYLPIQKK